MDSPRAALPPSWLLATGVGLLVCAARLAVLHQGAGAAPFLDQWHVEAGQVLVPWLEGRLRWTDFLAAHHEHYPVWTRLLAWLEAALLRTWDPLVQGTVNAALYGVFAGVVAAWLARQLPKLAALASLALLLVLYSLPHSWENSIWGLQSVVPLCLLFSFWHITGSLAHAPGRPGWWLAQLSGLAALGSFGGAWAAPLATTVILLWTEPRAWRRWIVPAALATFGLGLLAAAIHGQPAVGALAQHAADFTRLLGAATLHAGWPAAPGFATAVLHLPVFLLLLRARGRADLPAADRAILALALFSLAHALAFAAGRGGAYVGFVSRYSDFLALGVLANALALWRLGLARLAPRWLVALLALAWLSVLIPSLRELNRTGHTLYFQQNAAIWRAHRENALQRYLATRDPQHLASPEARAFLYPAPEAVARALATPGFVALLPASLRGADSPPVAGDAAGLAVRFLGGQLDAVKAAGALLLLLALVLPWPAAAAAATPRAVVPLDAALAALVGAAAAAAVFLWPAPWLLDPEARLMRLVESPTVVPEFDLRIVTPSPYPPDNLVGGAALWPEHFRNLYLGTHIDGPGFTGRAESLRFTLTTPWLVIPIAGYPASPGNGLRLELLEPDGRVTETIRYDGPNPDPIGFWSVAVPGRTGRLARVVLEDGQATGVESWVAVAAPLRVARDVGPTLRARWSAERTAPARLALVLFAGAAFLTAGALAFSARRRAA